MESRSEFYKQKVQNYQQALDKLQPVNTLVAVCRLCSFVFFLYAAYKWITVHSNGWVAATLLFIVAFIILVRIAWRLNDRKALLQKLVFINNNELRVLQNQPNQFNNGAAFNNGDNYAGDLDILGPGSLFQLLNRTTTWHGTHELANWLQQPLLAKEAIEQQQQAVQVLS